MKRRQLRAFDLKQIRGHDFLIGVDEAGRGALAGPVVAAAVEVTVPFLEGRWAQTRARKVNDSKKLTPEARSDVYNEMEALVAAGEIRCAFDEASVAEVENLNILGATRLAMRRALQKLHPVEAFQSREEPDLFTPLEEVEKFHPPVNARILVDGLRLRSFPFPHDGLVHGDARSLCIAMASILAKVVRDHRMNELDLVHPGYGFARHKGYGTEEHRESILRLGRCHQHRDTFLRRLYGRRRDVQGQIVFWKEG